MAALGAALLLAMVGYLGWLALTAEEGLPELSVRAEPARPSGDGWLVPFVLRNDGPSAAAAVRVRGRIGAGGPAGQAEESAVELDYVPQRAERRGGLLFGQAPGPGGASLRVEGYSEP